MQEFILRNNYYIDTELFLRLVKTFYLFIITKYGNTLALCPQPYFLVCLNLTYYFYISHNSVGKSKLTGVNLGVIEVNLPLRVNVFVHAVSSCPAQG